MSAWSCPHDLNGICQRVRGAICEPGMRGCELEGKVRFAREALNQPRKPVKASVQLAFSSVSIIMLSADDKMANSGRGERTITR